MRRNKMNKSACDIIREMMKQYDESRERWIATYSTSEGFDEWYTAQVKEAGAYLTRLTSR
jgi:hypothetical protein